MCGISAIVSPDLGIHLRLQERMLHTQRMRGPDAAAWQRFDDGRVSLGHTRLSLLDLGPTGDQPMEGERFVLVFNGEVYNHEELRSAATTYPWRGTSDTETVLMLLDTFGVRDTLPRLNGMFAFAAWDKKERVLWMATDPFGQKPLYTYHRPSSRAASAKGSMSDADPVFACASSSAALLHLQEKWQVNTAAVHRYFHLGGADGLWKGLRRMHGGTLAVYDPKQDRYREERWYTPSFWEGATPALLGDLVRDAIRISAKADVPVGIFFSGGIDTSVVASVVGQQMSPMAQMNAKASKASASVPSAPSVENNSPSHARPLAFHLDSSERAYAEQGAKHFGLDLHVIPVENDQVRALIDIAEKSGEPTMAGHIPWVVSQYAAQHVKACISGNGADELFFGYPRTATKPAEVAAMDAHLFRRAQAYMPNGVSSAWQQPSAAGHSLPAATAPAYSLTDPRFGFDARQRWRELQFYIQHDLNPTLDAASMCHSLEVRAPFLDVRVVECALSMDFSVHGRKRILKEMLAEADLSSAYYERQKLGFSMPNPGKEWERYAEQAWAMACKKYGFNPAGLKNYKEAGRDQGYLKAAAAGWRAWYEQHEHIMA